MKNLKERLRLNRRKGFSISRKSLVVASTLLVLLGSFFIAQVSRSALSLTILTQPSPESNEVPTVFAKAEADSGKHVAWAKFQIYSSDAGAPSGNWQDCVANNGSVFGHDQIVEFSCKPPSLSSGSYKMNIQAQDSENAISNIISDTFIVDREAPTIIFNDLNPGPSIINYQSPIFTGTITDNLTKITKVEYKWDLASTTASVPVGFEADDWYDCSFTLTGDNRVANFSCDAGYTFPNSLKSDEYRMHVRATDNVENRSGTTNYYRFQVDTVLPYGLQILTPSDPGITVYAGTNYDITWDPPSDDFELGSAPIKIEYSASGDFSDKITIIDGYGASGPYSWSIPIGYSSTNAAKIRITATDVAGNYISSDSDYPFTVVPYTKPFVAITPLPGNVSSSTLPITFEATATDPEGIVSARFRVYNAGWSGWNSCNMQPGYSSGDSPLVFNCTISSGLIQGTNRRIQVEATDMNGHTGDATYTFTYDTTKPVITIGSLGTINTPTKPGTTITDAVSGPDPSSYLWEQVSGPGTVSFANNTSLNPFISADNNGAYEVKFSACDLAGNCDSKILSFNWTNDPLTFAITNPLGGEILKGGDTLNITWTNPEGNEAYVFDVFYSINDGANWSGIITNIPKGNHVYDWTIPIPTPTINSQQVKIKVEVRDGGTIKLTSTSNAFTIDSTPPTVNAGNFVNAINIPTAPGATASDNFDSSGQLTYLWTNVSGPSGAQVQFSATNILNPTLAGTVNGDYTAKLRVTDRAGNYSEDTVSFTWNGSPESFNIINPSQFYYKGNTNTPITWEPADRATSYKIEYSIDEGANFAVITSSTQGSPSGSNLYYNWTTLNAEQENVFIRITASDNYGNITTANSINFGIDITPPVINLNGNLGTIYVPTQPTVSASDSPGSGIYSYNWTQESSSGGTISFSDPTSLNPLISASADGIYSAKLTVTDNVGLQSSKILYFTYDLGLPHLSITSPADGEIMAGGNTKLIKWSIDDPGNISNFVLSYSTDNGVTWTDIDNPLDPTTRQYDWTVPNENSSSAKIRVTANNDNGNSKSDKRDITIDSEAPTVIVDDLGNINAPTNPNPNVTDNIDDPSELTYHWTHVSGPATSIITTPDMQNPTLAGTVNGLYTVKLTVTDRAGNANSENITFNWNSSLGSFSVTNPTAGTYYGGNDLNITWTSATGATSYKIDYSTDGGSNFTNIINSTNNLSYLWELPTISASSVFVRVTASDTHGNTLSADSANFAIQSSGPSVAISGLAGTIYIPTTPTVSASAGAGYTITGYSWEKISGSGSVNFSPNSNTEEPQISANQSGAYTVRLTITNNVGMTASADASFIYSLEPPAPNITSPGEGNIFKGGDTKTIKWTASNPGNLNGFILSYYDGSSWIPITTINDASVRQFDWTVPSVTSATAKIRVEARNTDNKTSSDERGIIIDSQAPVITASNLGTISAPTLISPTVTDTIDNSGQLTYSWTHVSGPATAIISSPNTKDTNLSGTTNGLYTVKLTATDRAGNSSSKEVTFNWSSSLGSFSVTYPTAGTYNGGSTINVTWTPVAGAVSYKVEYSTNGGGNFNGIASGVTGTSQDWLIPVVNENSVFIRVTATDVHSNTSSADSANFAIQSSGPSASISGLAGTIYEPTIPAVTAHAGAGYTITSYSWTQLSGDGSIIFSDNNIQAPAISASQGGAYAVRLTVTNNVGMTASADASFIYSLKPPAPIITSPGEGDSLRGGSSKTVKWTITKPAPSNLTHFAFSYSLDNGANWTQVGTTNFNTCTENSIKYYCQTNWTVPVENSNNTKIRIEAVNSEGETSSDTRGVVIDSSAPTITVGGLGEINTPTKANPTVNDNFDGEGDLTYNWYPLSTPTGGNIIFSPTSNEKNPNLAGTVTGDYVARLIVRDQAGNESFADVPFSWNGNPDQPAVYEPVSSIFKVGGTNLDIKWTIGKITNLKEFKLYYTLDNGANWTLIDTVTSTIALDNIYNWTIPSGINSQAEEQTKIKVEAVDIYGNHNEGESSNFTIDSSGPVIGMGTITSPLSEPASVAGITVSDNIDATSDLTYKWTVTLLPYPNAVLTIDNDTATSTLFAANMTGEYQLRLTVTDRAGNSSFSPLTINWLSKYDPALTHPTGGESFAGGQEVEVTWDLLDPGNLSHIEAGYSIDNGLTWINIPETIASSSRSFIWETPSNTNSTSSLFRVITVDDDGIKATSSPIEVFTIDSTPPTVDAGSFSADVNSPTAPGASASDNFDDEADLTFVWSQDSAPSGGSINFGGGKNILNPELSGSTNGQYVARLTVYDRAGNSAYDTVSFTRKVASSGGGGGGGGGGAPVTCSAVVYGDWGDCYNGMQYRSIISTTPNSCSPSAEQQAAQQRSCTAKPQVCDYVYFGDWGECNNGMQYREILRYEPESCSMSEAQMNHWRRECSNKVNQGPFDEDALSIMEEARKAFTGTDQAMLNRLTGQILIQVEDHGRAWYVNATDKRRYYLGSPMNAFSVMSLIGQGITNERLFKIRVGLLDDSLSLDKDSDGDGLPDRLEEALLTNPFNRDSDGDGHDDKTEMLNGYDPNGPGKLPYDEKVLQASLGHIYIQVQTNGEAWYVEPKTRQRYYLGRPEEAFVIMRNFGIGITNQDLNKIPVGQFTDAQVARITKMLEDRKREIEALKNK